MTLEENGSDVFHAAIEMSLVPIVLADPHQGDCPIVFANGAFSELTGYDRAEIVGRNFAFSKARRPIGQLLRKSAKPYQSAGISMWNSSITGRTGAHSGTRFS
jgi:PAS domain S-box-containing protein